MEYFYPGLLERDRTASVRVAAGVELSGTDMSLPAVKIQTVRLKVEGLPADDRFAFEFVVMRKGAKNTTPVRTETQHLGDRVFRVSAIPAGTYEIAARFQGISAARQVYTGVLALSIPAEREGAEIDAGTMAARLDGFRITGKIVGTEYRVPSSGGSKTYPLLIRQMDGGMWSNGGIEITDEGTFVLSNVPRGRYQIVFTPLPAGLFLTAVHYGGRDILDTGFILEGEPVGPVEIVLGNASALGVVEGAVRTAEDEPAPFSAVVLIPPVGRQENPDAFRFTQADENGRFSIRNLLPGDYRVVAVADLEPYAYLAPEFSTNVGVRGERVTVNAGSLATITARVIPASN
jgi:hypothetical protein